MPIIILDADFLSSFLKIGRCDLIRSFYQVEHAVIPAAVHRELAQTDLLSQLLATRWIDVLSAEPPTDEALLRDMTFQTLGAGERACILLTGISGGRVQAPKGCENSSALAFYR